MRLREQEHRGVLPAMRKMVGGGEAHEEGIKEGTEGRNRK